MTTGSTVHFLLVYSHAAQKLVRQNEFKEARKAMRAYGDAEAEYLGNSDEFEIVLIGSDSIETIMKTHGHYFAGDTNDIFADLLAHA